MYDFVSRAGTLEIIVWAFFIGIVFGAVSMLYNKQFIGKFVRALLKSGADDPSNALSLEQLGFAKNSLVKHALRDGSVLRKMIWEAQDEVITMEDGKTFATRTKKTDINTARFYIDNSNRYRADLRYSAKGTDFITLLIAVIVFFVAAFAILWFVPYISKMFSSLF